MRAVALVLTCLAAVATAPPATAQQRARDFDYYVLALSWSPGWCRSDGDRRGAEQCDEGRKTGFTLHGLWPQNEVGYPANCRTAERDPSRRDTGGMADIMGSGGLAWYQWQKHGRCSGLPARDYLALSRAAFNLIAVPEYFADLNKDISIPPQLIEQAFIEANPGFGPDAITVSCQNGDLDEVRICLTKHLLPRDCAPDIRRDCAQQAIIMEKLR